MKLMITELYDALTAAGAPEDKARAAASAVAEFKTEMHEIRSDLRLLKWMNAFTLAGVMSLIYKAFG